MYSNLDSVINIDFAKLKRIEVVTFSALDFQGVPQVSADV